MSSTCCKTESSGSCIRNDNGTCTIRKQCKLQTPDGEFECECICTCECGKKSCEKCVCECQCSPETAEKIVTSEGVKYRCECKCKC